MVAPQSLEVYIFSVEDRSAELNHDVASFDKGIYCITALKTTQAFVKLKKNCCHMLVIAYN